MDHRSSTVRLRFSRRVAGGGFRYINNDGVATERTNEIGGASGGGCVAKVGRVGEGGRGAKASGGGPVGVADTGEMNS